MSGHTPGPWKIGKQDKKGRVWINGRGWWALARVQVVMDGAPEPSIEGASNAALIVNAPELLRCLSMTRAQWINSVHADEILALLARCGAAQPPKPEVTE